MTKDFKKGVLAAAAVANDYATTHRYRIDDCIAMKLNVVSRVKPRRNKRQLQDPKDAWVCGFVTVLAEMGRRRAVHKSEISSLADSAGVTLAVAKASKVNPYDIKELRRAGVE